MDPPALAADPQAAATIEAARITADAAIHAAWIQVGAALGAIGAGVLAYIGAVRQVRLQERAQEARTVAYRFRLSRIVDAYHARIAEAYSVAKAQLEKFQGDHASVEITSFRVVRPQTLHDENWEVHALLGLRAVELILVVDDSASRLAEFDREISDDNVKTDSTFERATVRKVRDTAGGAASHAPDDAIVDYVNVLETLREALASLRTELAKSATRPAWRRLFARFWTGLSAPPSSFGTWEAKGRHAPRATK